MWSFVCLGWATRCTWTTSTRSAATSTSASTSSQQPGVNIKGQERWRTHTYSRGHKRIYKLIVNVRYVKYASTHLLVRIINEKSIFSQFQKINYNSKGEESYRIIEYCNGLNNALCPWQVLTADPRRRERSGEQAGRPGEGLPGLEQPARRQDTSRKQVGVQEGRRGRRENEIREGDQGRAEEWDAKLLSDILLAPHLYHLSAPSLNEWWILRWFWVYDDLNFLSVIPKFLAPHMNCPSATPNLQI